MTCDATFCVTDNVMVCGNYYYFVFNHELQFIEMSFVNVKHCMLDNHLRYNAGITSLKNKHKKKTQM